MKNYKFLTSVRNFLELKYLAVILWVVAILALSLTNGFARVHNVNFVAIDGDWQNYNPIRRVLAGQVPFVDFPPYLGLGVIAINILPIALKNNFWMSLFTTNVTATICFILLSFLIFYLATKDRDLSMLFSAVTPIIFYLFGSSTNIFQNNTLTFVNQFLGGDLYNIGNSARIERGFIPIILVYVLLFLVIKRGKDIFTLFSKTRNMVITGLVIGFSILWSNDYGYSIVAAAGLTVLFVLLYRKIKIRKIVALALTYAISVFGGLILSATIFTLGHPGAFLETSLGITNYQYWYFNLVKIAKFSDLFWVVDPLYFPVPLVLIVLIYRFVKKDIKAEDILLLFLILTDLFVTILYGIGSGAVNNIILLYVSLTAILGWAVRYGVSKSKSSFRPVIALAILVACLTYTFSAVVTYQKNQQTQGKTFVPELGGYTDYGWGLNQTKSIIGNHQVFSEYATALEAMTHQFQPSGFDYIIHVLGDKQRAAYLSSFTKGNFEYAQTIKDSYSPWEAWNVGANWFWYRELFKNYTPISTQEYSDTTDYNLLWKKSNTSLSFNLKSDISIKKLNGTSTSITVKTDKGINCFADVKISYDTSLTNQNILARLDTFREYLLVNDRLYNSTVPQYGPPFSGQTFGIPNSAKSYEIPILIKNGAGQVTISSFPNDSTSLQVDKAEIVQFLPDNVTNKGNSLLQTVLVNQNNDDWVLGVSKLSNTLLFPFNDQTNELLLQNNPQELIAGDYSAKVRSVKIDGGYIQVTLDASADKEKFAYPTTITIK